MRVLGHSFLARTPNFRNRVSIGHSILNLNVLGHSVMGDIWSLYTCTSLQIQFSWNLKCGILFELTIFIICSNKMAASNKMLSNLPSIPGAVCLQLGLYVVDHKTLWLRLTEQHQCTGEQAKSMSNTQECTLEHDLDICSCSLIPNWRVGKSMFTNMFLCVQVSRTVLEVIQE